MPRINLFQTRPGLGRGILLLALTHYLVGGLILYGTILGPPRQNVWLTWLFIGAFFVTGSLILYGLFAPHYTWIRIGLLGGLGLIGFLALVFVLAIGTSLSAPETIRLSWLIAPWPFWAIAHYLYLFESPGGA